MAVATAPKARLARITGTFLVPGVSRSGRLYTAENIASAVESLTERIGAGEDAPPDQRALIWGTHTAARNLAHDPDSADASMIVGRITRAWQDDKGRGRFEADVPDTAAARDYASLAANGYSPNVSVRFDWGSPVRRTVVDGHQVETADVITMRGIDMTPKPGVPEARIDSVQWEAAPRDVAGAIVETFEAAAVHVTEADNDDDMEASAATVLDPDHDGDVDGLRCPSCGAVVPVTDPRLNPDAGDDGPIESAPADAHQETSVSETTAPAAPATEAAPAPASAVTLTAEQFKELLAAIRPANNTEAAPAAPIAGTPEGGTQTEAADLEGMVRKVLTEFLFSGDLEVKRKGLVNTESAPGQPAEPAAPKSRAEAIAAVAERRTAQINARRELGLPV